MKSKVERAPYWVEAAGEETMWAWTSSKEWKEAAKSARHEDEKDTLTHEARAAYHN